MQLSSLWGLCVCMGGLSSWGTGQEGVIAVCARAHACVCNYVQYSSSSLKAYFFMAL